MTKHEIARITEAKAAARKVLLQTSVEKRSRLPRAAAWGYPEPYTRDIMISALGYLVSGEQELVNALKQSLQTLAANQTSRGHIPSIANEADNRGASDTTPLFLFALALFRRHAGDPDFLDAACRKALTWMEYQSPDDLVMVAQLPTSDWRDEQSVIGYGLFVNTIVYAYLRLHGREAEAATLRSLMNRLEVKGPDKEPHVHEGLVIPSKPYYALYSYKLFNSDRFDLLGNALAVLGGIASPSRSESIIRWVEGECRSLRDQGELAVDLPPVLFPYIRDEHPDWRSRYEEYNQPGEYHNGGLWPFVCGFYVAACVAVGRFELAEKKLVALTDLVSRARRPDLDWGFNEWIKAQDGLPSGQDWQTWSAALYLYAAHCVETRSTPFFEEVRGHREEPAATPPAEGADSSAPGLAL